MHNIILDTTEALRDKGIISSILMLALAVVLAVPVRAEPIAVCEAEADFYVLRSQPDTVQSNPGPDGDWLVVRNSASSALLDRKAYIRFNLSGKNPDLTQPAELVWQSGALNGNGAWRVYALNAGFEPGEGIQGMDWNPYTLTWNNAPAMVNSRDTFTADATYLGLVSYTAGTEEGSEFSITIPDLEDFLQADETLTVMFSVNGGSSSAVTTIVSSENATYDGPRLLYVRRVVGSVIMLQ